MFRKIIDLILSRNIRREPPSKNCAQSPELSNVTLRTFTPGGDPFEDRIEFHLRKDPTLPSGFRDPSLSEGTDQKPDSTSRDLRT